MERRGGASKDMLNATRWFPAVSNLFVFIFSALPLFGFQTCYGASLLGPVEESYFGMVLSKLNSNDDWPTVKVGSVRLWDAYVTWPYLEPAPGKWDFAALDRQVSVARAHGVNILLVLAHSPTWASSRPNESSSYRPGFAAPPAERSNWQRYVETVGKRYKGSIKEFQIWNEPSDKGHYSGSVEQLVEMTCDAYRILKALDDKIQIVSPPNAGGGRHIDYLDRFLTLGGARCIDVVSHHFYVPRFGPEAMIPMIRSVKSVMEKNGVGNLPLWCTEVGWWIESPGDTSTREIPAKGGWRRINSTSQLSSYIQRTFLVARAEGVGRVYWYAWGNRYGWSLTSDDGSAKVGVSGWQKSIARLLGNRVERCIYTQPIGSCILETDRNQVKITWQDNGAMFPLEGPATDFAVDLMEPH